MSTSIDKRGVELFFDNKNFENSAKNSMETIDNLKNKLNFNGATKGLEGIGAAAQKVDLSPISNATDTISVKFSAMQIAAATAISRITNSAIDAGHKIVSTATADIQYGFNEYETKLNAIQTIMSNTKSKGNTMDEINDSIATLNDYANQTIYSFAEMTRNMGTFTAAGIELKDSQVAIEGIGNLAAASGSTSQQAATAMYQLSQALAAGSLKLQDWNSVVNAGMGGQIFQDALKETAKEFGMDVDSMIDDAGSFRESLSDGWVTSEVLITTLKKFSPDGLEALAAAGYDVTDAMRENAQTMLGAAADVKTFTQLCDVLKQTAGAYWDTSFQYIIGDFDEAKALWTEVNNAIGKVLENTAKARNDLLKEWHDLGGRADLIQALRNTIEGLVSVVKPIKEAFSEIFPPITAKQLLNLTSGLKELTSHFKISDETAAKLKDTFKGVFAVIDLARYGIMTLAKCIVGLLGHLSGTGGGILDFTAKIGRMITGVDESIVKYDLLGEVIQSIKDKFKMVIDKVKEFAEAISKNFDFAPLEAIEKIIHSIHNRFSDLIDAMKDASTSIFGKLKPLFDFVKQAGMKIIEIMGRLTTSFVKGLGKGDFNGFFDTANAVAIGTVAATIIKAIKSTSESVAKFGGVFSEFKSMLTNINGILTGVKDCFKAYQEQLKANILLKIAGAIAILTASIFVLSIIDSAKLTIAIGALGGLFAGLVSSMAALDKISGTGKKNKNLSMLSVAMIAMSISVLILASAVKKLADVDSGALMRAVWAVSVLSAIMTICAKELSSNEKKMMKGATVMVGFAIAVKILASAVKDLASLSWKEIAKGLVGVSALMAVISIFINETKFQKRSISTGISIVLLATAMKILASAVKDFGALSWTEIGKGLAAISVLLYELSAFVNTTGNAKKLIATGLSLVLIGAAMKILASACADFGALSWAEIRKGLVSMAGALTAITIAVNLMPKNMVGIGLGLVLVGASLLIIANALQNMSSMSWGEIGKGLATLAGSLIILATALHFMKGTGGGAMSLLVAASAITILTPSLKALGKLNIRQIAKSLGMLVGVFTILGVAGYVLAPVAPIILMLAAALTLMGVSVVAVGAGLMTIGLGLQLIAIGVGLLASAYAAGGTMIMAAITSIILAVAAAIPQVLVLLVQGILDTLTLIGEKAPSIVEAFTKIVIAVLDGLIACIPKIIETIKVLFEELLKFIVEETPNVVNAALDILLELLKGIRDHIQDIVEVAAEIVVNFIEGIAAKLPDIIQAGFDLLISFIEGITQAIDENSERLARAMSDLFWTILEAALTIIRVKYEEFKEHGGELMDKLKEGIADMKEKIKEKVKSIIEDAKQKIKDMVTDFKDVGEDLIDGLIEGIENIGGKVKDKVEGIGKKAVKGLKEVLDIHSPSRVFKEIGEYADLGLIQGLESYSGDIEKVTNKNGTIAIEAMKDAMSEVDDILNSDIGGQPCIKPIMDLSNVSKGVDSINGMMDSTRTLNATANISANMGRMNSSAIRDTQIQNGIDNSDVVKSINKLIDLTESTNRLLTEQTVVLDDGTLVGKIAPAMDRELGDLRRWKNA